MNETLEIEKYIIEPSKNLMTLSNHIGRYYYAIKKIDIGIKDSVLDISCGQGYGTYILSHICKYAYGADINSDSIIKARSLFQKDNLLYSDNMIMLKAMNKIVCLETIEHMKKENILLFINGLFNILLPNGSIFFSFPLGKNEPSEYNRYHICEPSIDYIFDILNKNMSKINFEISKYTNDYGHECNYCYVWGKK